MTTMPFNNNERKFYKCEYQNCYMKFRKESLFSKHRKYHDKYKKVYTCTICTVSFVIKQHYENHMQKHDKDSFQCTVCDKIFRDEKKVKVHASRVHSGHRLQCHLCDEICNCTRSLNIHILKMHSFKSIESCSSVPVTNTPHLNDTLITGNKTVAKKKLPLKTVTERKLPLELVTESKLPLEIVTENKLPLKVATKSKFSLETVAESKLLFEAGTESKSRLLPLVNKDVTLPKQKDASGLVQCKQHKCRNRTRQDSYKSDECSEISQHHNFNPPRRKSLRLCEKGEALAGVEETKVNISPTCRNLRSRKSPVGHSSNISVYAKRFCGNFLLKDKKQPPENCQPSKLNKEVVKQSKPNLPAKYIKSEFDNRDELHKSEKPLSMFELNNMNTVTKRNNKMPFNDLKNDVSEDILIKDEISDVSYKHKEISFTFNYCNTSTVNNALSSHHRKSQTCEEDMSRPSRLNRITAKQSQSTFSAEFIKSKFSRDELYRAEGPSSVFEQDMIIATTRNKNMLSNDTEKNGILEDSFIKTEILDLSYRHKETSHIGSNGNIPIVNKEVTNVLSDDKKSQVYEENVSQPYEINRISVKQSQSAFSAEFMKSEFNIKDESYKAHDPSDSDDGPSSVFEQDMILATIRKKMPSNDTENEISEDNLKEDDILDLSYKLKETSCMASNSNISTVNNELINVSSDNRKCEENVIKGKNSTFSLEHTSSQNDTTINDRLCNMSPEVEGTLTQNVGLNTISEQKAFLTSDHSNGSIANDQLNIISLDNNGESHNTLSTNRENHVNTNKLKENGCLTLPHLCEDSPASNVSQNSEIKVNEKCVVACTKDDKSEYYTIDNMTAQDISTTSVMSERTTVISDKPNIITEKQEIKLALENVENYINNDSLIENKSIRSSSCGETTLNTVAVKQEPCETETDFVENHSINNVSLNSNPKEDANQTIKLSPQNKRLLKKSSLTSLLKYRKDNFNGNKIKKKVRFQLSPKDKESFVSKQNLLSQNDTVSVQNNLSPEKLKIIIRRDKLTGNIISSPFYNLVTHQQDNTIKKERGFKNISFESKEGDRCLDKPESTCVTKDLVMSESCNNSKVEYKKSSFNKNKSKKVKLKNMILHKELHVLHKDLQNNKIIVKEQLLNVSHARKINENMAIENTCLGSSYQFEDLSHFSVQGNVHMKQEPFILLADDKKDKLAPRNLMHMKSILRQAEKTELKNVFPFQYNRLTVKQQSFSKTNTQVINTGKIKQVNISCKSEVRSLHTVQEELSSVHSSFALRQESFKKKPYSKKRKSRQNDLHQKIVKKCMKIKDKTCTSVSLEDGQPLSEKSGDICKSKCEELLSRSLLADIYELEKKYSFDLNDNSKNGVETLQNKPYIDLNKPSSVPSGSVKCKSYDNILKGLLLETSNYTPNYCNLNRDKYSENFKSESKECNLDALNDEKRINAPLEDSNNLPLNLHHSGVNNVKTNSQLCKTFKKKVCLQNKNELMNTPIQKYDALTKTQESLLSPSEDEKNSFIYGNCHISYVGKKQSYSLKSDCKSYQKVENMQESDSQPQQFLHSNSLENTDKRKDIGSNNSQPSKYLDLLINNDKQNQLYEVKDDKQLVNYVLNEYKNKIVRQQFSAELGYNGNKLIIMEAADKSCQYIECQNGVKKYLSLTSHQNVGKVMNIVPENAAASAIKTEIFVNVNDITEELSVTNLNKPTVVNKSDDRHNKIIFNGFVPESDRTSSYEESIEAVVNQQYLDEDKILKCHICGMRKITEFSLYQHMILHSATCPYSCNICGKPYIQKRHLERHKRIHTINIGFTCPVCHRIYASSSNLDIHILRQHPSFSYFICEKCGEPFIYEIHLNKHLLTHS